MKRPVHIVQHGCEAKDIVDLAAIASFEAQENEALEPVAVQPAVA